jgi:cytochrome c oxidase subunit IV
MSDTAQEHRTDAVHDDVHHTDEHHPTPKQYVQIAIVLAVLTGMEVAASFIDIGPAFLPTLIGLMAIKFVLVAGWFMHLKFDTRLYTRLMVGGLGLALSLYAVVMVLFAGHRSGEIG